MAEKSDGSLLEREDVGDVTVLRVQTAMLQGDEATDDLFQQVTALVEDGGRHWLVLNLAAVQYLASRALGKLVALGRKVREVKGRVALCQPTPTVDRLLEATYLAEIIPVYRDEREAVRSFA